MKTLHTLFLNELGNMYGCENRIITALPKLIKVTTCDHLREALQQQLEQRKARVEQLEPVFAAFDQKPKAQKCPAIQGLLDEVESLVSEHQKSPAINAAIIAACQKMEHYQIASYGTLRAWAELLEKPEAAEILAEILDEAKESDHAFTELAEEKNKETLQEVASEATA